jgi:hypothetical protein
MPTREAAAASVLAVPVLAKPKLWQSRANNATDATGETVSTATDATGTAEP